MSRPIRARRKLCDHRARTEISSSVKEEIAMYVTEIVWWAYTAFVAAIGLFVLVFALKVREKGD